ncbi:hypothetical protein BJF81_15450 [Ornithinimicrobium sp. CNJ-824]|uniref:hypothetical protein n=1 Tax=Ornithinimicrobium sp. CNJ-824 TaxID=1904966 RepID=UPI0009643371|nr:hypothetical protein [Ornithinimicrobium sp. CNJ-824]OLT21263.1 hypothetical protein BJF81_15450 [Ornithinimicrobium sp. CNJ-824]
MQKQTVRQQARARARQARAKVLQEQAKRERRLAKRGEAVAVALAERAAVVSDCEQRAGRALRSLIEEEGLSTQEALAWCGDDTLTGREVYRLIRGVTDEDEGDTGGDGDQGEEQSDTRGGEDQGEESPEVAPASAGPAESMPG